LISLFLSVQLTILGKVSFAQTFRIDVKIDTERLLRLLPEEQQVFELLPQQLNDYLNNYDWSSGENEEIIIDCSLSLVIETMSNRGSEKIYQAQFLISSPSGENFVDRSIEFRYQPGQPIDHERSYFDPLLSLVDFYVYMVLGGELDSWLLRGGSRYYDLALSIANQGVISNYSTGWRSRIESVQLITDSDHIPLREAKYYYYDCLYHIEAKKDRNKSNNLAIKLIELLEQIYNRRPQSQALLRFFNAHFTEICKLFSFSRDPRLIDRIIAMDTRHTETYNDCKENISPF
jgi:hypothetical protein